MAYSEKHKLYMREWTAKNREKINARNRAAYAADPTRTAARNNASKERNRERYLERRRQEYQRRRAAGKHWTAEIRERSHAWTEKNRERIRARERARYHANEECKVANVMKAGARRRAICKWADQEKVWLIYAEARRLTRETGIKHVVDHMVPLKHPLVCGLHNEFNLRVLTQLANGQKRNKFAPQEMPA